jgi:hypothetical protein
MVNVLLPAVDPASPGPDSSPHTLVEMPMMLIAGDRLVVGTMIVISGGPAIGTATV